MAADQSMDELVTGLDDLFDPPLGLGDGIIDTLYTFAEVVPGQGDMQQCGEPDGILRCDRDERLAACPVSVPREVTSAVSRRSGPDQGGKKCFCCGLTFNAPCNMYNCSDDRLATVAHLNITKPCNCPVGSVCTWEVQPADDPTSVSEKRSYLPVGQRRRPPTGRATDGTVTHVLPFNLGEHRMCDSCRDPTCPLRTGSSPPQPRRKRSSTVTVLPSTIAVQVPEPPIGDFPSVFAIPVGPGAGPPMAAAPPAVLTPDLAVPFPPPVPQLRLLAPAVTLAAAPAVAPAITTLVPSANDSAARSFEHSPMGIRAVVAATTILAAAPSMPSHAEGPPSDYRKMPPGYGEPVPVHPSSSRGGMQTLLGMLAPPAGCRPAAPPAVAACAVVQPSAPSLAASPPPTFVLPPVAAAPPAAETSPPGTPPAPPPVIPPPVPQLRLLAPAVAPAAAPAVAPATTTPVPSANDSTARSFEHSPTGIRTVQIPTNALKGTTEVAELAVYNHNVAAVHARAPLSALVESTPPTPLAPRAAAAVAALMSGPSIEADGARWISKGRVSGNEFRLGGVVMTAYDTYRYATAVKHSPKAQRDNTLTGCRRAIAALKAASRKFASEGLGVADLGGAELQGRPVASFIIALTYLLEEAEAAEGLRTGGGGPVQMEGFHIPNTANPHAAFSHHVDDHAEEAGGPYLETTRVYLLSPGEASVHVSGYGEIDYLGQGGMVVFPAWCIHRTMRVAPVGSHLWKLAVFFPAADTAIAAALALAAPARAAANEVVGNEDAAAAEPAALAEAERTTNSPPREKAAATRTLSLHESMKIATNWHWGETSEASGESHVLFRDSHWLTVKPAPRGAGKGVFAACRIEANGRDRGQIMHYLGDVCEADRALTSDKVLELPGGKFIDGGTTFCGFIKCVLPTAHSVCFALHSHDAAACVCCVQLVEQPECRGAQERRRLHQKGSPRHRGRRADHALLRPGLFRVAPL